MARPKSEEKRLAILHAAAEIVAEHGLSAAPTSLIAKRAKVAEGTLFLYFPTKNDLFNELYIHLKKDMCDALTEHYDSTKPFRARFWSLWESYINWGLAHPIANKAVNQLAVSSILTSETIERTNAMFPEVDVATRFSNNEVFEGRDDFAEAIFTALADTTMAFAGREPENAKAFKESGFAVLWKMYEDN